MSSRQLKLLLVEDSKDDADLLVSHLIKEGFKINQKRVYDKKAYTEALAEDWDAIISDYNLPAFNALDAIQLAKSSAPEIPLIVVSGTIGEVFAIETVRAGASDYVMKGNLLRLVPALERALKERNFRTENKQIEEKLKKREEELRQAQKLEAIGQLAGGIAHDFNNVLAAILVEVDYLSGELNSNLPIESLIENVGGGLTRVKSAGNRARNLTRQLLAFSRKQVLLPKVLNLNSAVNDLEKMLRPLIEENIVFKLNLSKDLKNIKADPGQIEQIILNLVVNSRDAMPQGGTLEILTCNSHLEKSLAERNNVSTGPYSLLEVRDTGMGMSDEVKTRLFEPFFTTKPVGKGTGLGLSTVYGIVKQNQGLIFVESQVNKGTTFKVYFPSVDEKIETTTQAPAETNISLKGNETILLVEDETVLRDILSKVLKNNGYEVLTANNGIEALDTLRSFSKKIHLVITDVVMPQMGGSELASKIQDLKKDIKILFQSGYTEDTLIQNGVKEGQIYFLEKPYNLNDFLTKVRRVLS